MQGEVSEERGRRVKVNEVGTSRGMGTWGGGAGGGGCRIFFPEERHRPP